MSPHLSKISSSQAAAIGLNKHDGCPSCLHQSCSRIWISSVHVHWGSYYLSRKSTNLSSRSRMTVHLHVGRPSSSAWVLQQRYLNSFEVREVKSIQYQSSMLLMCYKNWRWIEIPRRQSRWSIPNFVHNAALEMAHPVTDFVPCNFHLSLQWFHRTQRLVKILIRLV